MIDKRKEAIELLENSYRVLDDDRYVIDIIDYEKILTALKAEPKAEFTRLPDGRQVNLKEFTKECRELIKTEEDDKGWKAISGYIVWLETRAELACELIDSQQTEQPKAGEFTKEARRQLDIGVNVLDGFLREACDKLDSRDKRLELLLFNRNELFDETVKLQAELASAKERIEAIGKYAYHWHCCINDSHRARLFKIVNMCQEALEAEQKGTDDA